MKKEIRYDRWIVIDTTHGVFAIPQDYVGKTTQITADDVADYIEGEFLSAELVDGYGARLTRPGYLDCTDWTVYKTEEQAERCLSDMYDDD